MKIGIRFETNSHRWVFAIDPEYFYWKPGEIESGSSSPAQFFDAMSDRYWLYGWLGLTFFYAEATT